MLHLIKIYKRNCFKQVLIVTNTKLIKFNNNHKSNNYDNNYEKFVHERPQH